MTEALLLAQVVAEKIVERRRDIIEVFALAVGFSLLIIVAVVLVVAYGTLGR